MASILDGVGALECERIGYGGVHLCGDGSGGRRKKGERKIY